MNMYEKSLMTLELPAVLEMLSNEASSPEARQAARELRPAESREEIEYRLSETTAAKRLIALRGSPSFYGVRDVRPSVRRADLGGVLLTRELLDIAALLRAAAEARDYGTGEREERTAIDGLFEALTANKYLESRITSCIISEEEIADSASPELSDIRRHMRLTGDKIRQTLQRIISSPSYAKALQEPIVTMRNDRYVVPVKAEHKGAVPGLVHDVSSSGATFFIEPMAVVELNNELRELQAREKKEIERILAQLSAECAHFGEDILRNYEILVQLDLIFAKARLSYRLKGSEPALSQDDRLVFRRARHPLLDPKTAVPIDVRLGGTSREGGFDTLVITGPNTGGKTVTLKTLGLLAAMAYCGLHIPADEGSCLPLYPKILADIGDEQSIEQSLSTFSSHMVNIVGILGECVPGSLLLFDELGAGTDPAEGAALAVAIIERARNMGAYVAATTHYAELKAYALTTPGVMNASCEFDVETLRPTFRLLIGIPGKSNAFAISEKLGLPRDIIEDARRRVGAQDAAFEDILESLEKTRQTLEAEREEARRLLNEAREKAAQAEKDRQAAARERDRAKDTARREAEEILKNARREAEAALRAVRALRRKAAREADAQKTNEAGSEIFRRLNAAEGRLAPKEEARKAGPAPRPIAPGDRVKLLALGVEADVVETAPDGTLTLQAGVMKVTARPDEVELLENPARKEIKKYLAASAAKAPSAGVSPEIDLRGMTTDEALAALEKYLDNARLARLNTVTIIHGKGTGALRAAVHAALRREPGVAGFRLGRFGEGEMGVTIVELR